MKILFFSFFFFFITPIVFAAQTTNIPADIKEAVRFRVDQGYNVGIVVGVVNPKGTQYYSYGKTSISGNEAPNENTIFEIGSITKVFTTLLLADMVERGEVALDDPIEQYLPRTVRVPTRNGQSITLAHLATHTSGLPRMPSNFNSADPNNPYADYSVEQMYDFLSKYTLEQDIGKKYEYSNLGAGLLGHILAFQSRTTYEELFKKKIAHNLGLASTCITLTPELKKHLARGHRDGIEVSNWDLPTLAGAGALRSTARDMLTFLAANIGLKKSRLQSSMETTHRSRHQAGSPDMHIGLGWHIRTSGNRQIIWHNGGTGGYRSFAGFVTKTKTGVVVLTNSFQEPDDIGFHLLDPNLPLQKFQASSKVEQMTLKNYVGKYKLAPGVLFDIALQNGQLTAQLTGQARFTIFAKSRTDFFYKVIDAQITFITDKKGEVTALVLHQNGIDRTASKLGPDYQPAPQRKEVSVKSEILKSYVGKYKLSFLAIFDIKLKNGLLTAQLTGQQRLPVYAESETKFFYKVVDAQITFVKNETGETTALILHQNGIDQTAKKIQ